MTNDQFDSWVNDHYDELLAVAVRRGAGADAVDSAVLRALESLTFANLEPQKCWPWMVDAVRSVISHGHRGEERTKAAHAEVAGAFLSEEGTYTPLRVGPQGSGQIAERTRIPKTDPFTAGSNARLPLVDLNLNYKNEADIWRRMTHTRHGDQVSAPVERVCPGPCGAPLVLRAEREAGGSWGESVPVLGCFNGHRFYFQSVAEVR